MITTSNSDTLIVDPTRRFYVSAIDDTGRKHAFLLGPFELHSTALDKISLVKSICYDIDPKAPWYYYGTCSLTIEDANRIEGKLNNHPRIKPLS